MKNVIKYYYNLNPSELHQINKIIKFSYQNKNYILYPTIRTIEEIDEIYKLSIYLLKSNIYCHRIILNINKNIITTVNNKNYVLLEMNIQTRTININDILYFFNIGLNENSFTYIKRDDWYKLWINKVDYIEYQISQFGKKYKLIRESSDYYIGIVENCISILSNINNYKSNLSISHNRINYKTTTEDFYNPIEFIIDKRVRDIGEYIKTLALVENKIEVLKIIYDERMLNNYEIILLFTRILYPSIYFDIYELIINNKESENKLKQIIDNVDKNENEIKKIYNYLRSIFKIPEIEWLQ